MSNLPQVPEEEKQYYNKNNNNNNQTKQRSDLQSHAHFNDDDTESVFNMLVTDRMNDQQQQSITPGGEDGTIYEMLQENKQAVMNLNYLPNEEKSNNMNQMRRNMSTFLFNFIVNIGKFKIRRISN